MFGAGKITEKSLFQFMSIMTNKVPNINPSPTELLSLHDYESDMFLDIFSQDFIKITAFIHAKK